MILLLDIGNTSTKSACYNLKKNKILKISSYLTKDKNLIPKIINECKKNKITKIMTTSVVPKKYNFLKRTVIKKKIKIFEFKDKNILKDIKINLAKKNQVGSDRLTNAYGALNYYKKNCIIVDFGTTTTFDIADFRNIYQGGVIAPGISLSLTALNQFTAKLPLIKITRQKKVIGKDTKSAINSGVFLGYACLINGILNKIFHQTKKKYLIILTGGYSSLFKSVIDFKSIVNQQITLYGLAKVVKQNKRLFSEI